MKQDQWQRKRIRIPNFDYAEPQSYFITICTNERKPVFWENVVAASSRHTPYQLSDAGAIVDVAIQQITRKYPWILVDKYCIMPDHIHLIVRICADAAGNAISARSISTVIGQMKQWVTKQIGYAVWQKSFMDRIIRNEQEYLAIWTYIENNPMKYALDRSGD